MTKILYVEGGSGWGGSTVALARLLASLDRTRFSPIVVLERAGASTRLLQQTPAELITLSRPFDRLFARALRPPLSYVARALELLLGDMPHLLQLIRVIRTRRVALVHLNNHVGPQVAGILAAKLCRVPCVLHLRNSRPLTWLERLAVPWVDQFIVLSHSSLRTYAAQGLPASRMHVLYEAVHTNGHAPDRQASRKVLGLAPRAKIIGMLSRMEAGKGHEDFLNAAAHVCRRFPHAVFLVVHRADAQPLLGRLEALVRELHLERRVIFTEWMTDVQRLIASLDIVVDASTLHEGVRLTILESMAAGKPVIATAVGNLEEFFHRNQRGLLVAPGEPEALAQAIATLLERPRYARQLGAAARTFVQHHCDPQQFAQQLEGLYDVMVSTPSMRVPRPSVVQQGGLSHA